jgi:hypothetical protein
VKFFHFAVAWVVAGAVSLSAAAQDAFLEDRPMFKRSDLNLNGRLRQLTVEEVLPDVGREIVILEREGEYPAWKLRLSIWSGSRRRAEIPLPSDLLYYAFVRRDPSGVSPLLLIRSGSVELWQGKSLEEKVTWEVDPRFVRASDFPAATPQLGNAEPFDPVLSDGILVPSQNGFVFLGILPKGFELRKMFSVPPRAFHRSSSERMPFELPFSMRSSLWYPMFHAGSRTGAKPGDAVFFPWMDEVTIAPMNGGADTKTITFRQLSEAERDDAQSYVVTAPDDLNGDGRMDFVVNKFQGEAASLRAETTLFLTGADGTVPEKGISLAPRGNRTAGALAIDLNRDGKKDLVAASSQFNAWAVVKALVQHQADVSFSFYYFHGDGYHLDRPDFEREISFRFNLADLAIEGMLPTLEGDFNGDGYPDALYARDRKTLTILIQKPGEKDPFAPVPSGTYDVPVARLWRVADVNGDGKSDVVFYDRRSAGNRRVTLLVNAGRLR